MNMRRIYRKIARDSGVTVAEVKRDMQFAIDETFKNTPRDGVTQAYQDQVPRKGEIPTVEEFVRFCVDKLNEGK